MTNVGRPRGDKVRVRITPAHEDRIVAIITDWKPSWGEMTGDVLAQRVFNEIGIKWSRQGILKRSRIRDEFDAASTALASNGATPSPPLEIEALKNRVRARDHTIVAKDEEIRRLKEVIVRHHYHARKHGISLAEIEAPIPPMVVPADQRTKPGPRPRPPR